jgi:thiopeptide-type bacteriocin biosynthesis protein
MSASPATTPFDPAGFFVLRTPLLPFDEFLAWSEQAAGDRTVLRQRLRALIARPEVREALFIASPALEERLDTELAAPDSPGGQKMERALARYLTRMTSRATPFGLFAGCSVGTLADETCLQLPARTGYERHTRLDMDYQHVLTSALGRSPAIRSCLNYRPNSSLYRIPGRLRYIEARRQEDQISHHVIALEDTDYLQCVLARAGGGASCTELTDALLAFAPDASHEEADEYVADLIDMQVLVSDLHPTITGAESLAELVDQLRPLAAARSAVLVLEKMRTELTAIDAAGLTVSPTRYREAANQLGALPARIDLARLFQVDLIKPAPQATLGRAHLEEITGGLAILHRVARPLPALLQHLKRFRESFVARYEAQAVPLVEALDAEAGVGFGGGPPPTNSLLEGIDLPGPADSEYPWRKQDHHLLRLVVEAATQGRPEIALGPDDLDALAEDQALPLPDSFTAIASVARLPDESPDAYQIHLVGGYGSPGARLLGRFCYADQGLHEHVRRYLRAEEALHPEAVFAEIVHVPEHERLGNILFRPVLRDYEISFLGRSGARHDQQLPLADLLVSVVGEEIRLWSAKLGRRVFPCLTTAHNFRGRGHILYRFLCALQEQGATAGLQWDWGPLGRLPFLPRVVIGRLVLSRAQWRMDDAEVKAVVAAGQHGIPAWRQRRRLPRLVELLDGEDALLVDLENLLSVEMFLDLLRKRKEAVLIEMFPPPEWLNATGPEGRFVHELLVPFVRRAKNGPDEEETRGPAIHASSPLLVPLPVRRFVPGSEWLYAKLYAGPIGVDQLLRDVIRPLVSELLAREVIDRWFFVRYADPDWHLRLRFHGDPQRLHEEALPALEHAVAPWLGDGRIRRFQLDTYEREVERYGGPEGILWSERLFHADSDAVLALVARLVEDSRADQRWRLALCGSHRLLEDLGLDLAGKLAVARNLRRGFGFELRAATKVRQQLGEKFRRERKTLAALLEHSESFPGLEFACAVLDTRTVQWASSIQELHRCEQAGGLTVPVPELATSFVHMHVNRLLLSDHHPQELVLYDFLVRYYQSQSAREPGALANGVIPVPSAQGALHPPES